MVQPNATQVKGTLTGGMRRVRGSCMEHALF
jgi:hypothetical protein